MKLTKWILAAAAMASAAAPVAASASQAVRPADSLVAPTKSVEALPTRAGAALDQTNALSRGYWIAIVIGVGVLIWVFIEVLDDDEPESPGSN